MTRLLGIFVALLALAVPLSAATIGGTVTQSGSALASMTVQAYDTAGILRGSATTDAAGHYTLTLASGSYRVLAFDPNGVYATSFYRDAESFDTSLVLNLQTTLANVDFALVRGGLVAGTVTSTGGAPLSSITVVVYNPSGTTRGFTTTDAAGHYQVVVPAGSYRVVAYDDAQNYVTSFFNGATTFASATPVSVSAASTTNVNFALTRGASLSGTLVDAATNAPLANVTVALYANGVITATTVTDASGHYRLLVVPGTYRVVAFDANGVYAPTYAPDAESFDTSASYPLAPGDARTVDLRLARGGRITGRVTDGAGGAALPGMTVAAFNADGTTRAFTTTDAAGNYTLVVPPGAYRVAAFDPGLVYVRRFFPNEATFAAASAVSVFVSQTTTANLALPHGIVITGQVTNAGASTLSGITVAAYDTSGIVASTVTDAAGTYRLVVDAGTYRLAAFDLAFRYASAFAAVTVASTNVQQNFDLVRGAHVTGTVSTSTGIALAGMTVAAYDAAGFLASSAVTRDDGTYDVVLPPGTYRLAAFDPSSHFAPSTLTDTYALTSSSPTTVISFQLRATSSARRRAAMH